MAKDETTFVELLLGRTMEDIKGGLWGMEISGQELKIESLLLKVWLC